MNKLAVILTTAITIMANSNVMAQRIITQTAGCTALGDFAPKFAELNDDILFGEAVWNDSTLTLHDHSMVTISILLGKGLIDSSFRSHLEMGKSMA
jgi:4-carboxymuconolactone decarboxylase